MSAVGTRAFLRFVYLNSLKIWEVQVDGLQAEACGIAVLNCVAAQPEGPCLFIPL